MSRDIKTTQIHHSVHTGNTHNDNNNNYEMHLLFENISLCPWILNKLTTCKVVMGKGILSKVLKFVTQRSGVPVLGWGYINCKVYNHEGWQPFSDYFDLL